MHELCFVMMCVLVTSMVCVCARGLLTTMPQRVLDAWHDRYFDTAPWYGIGLAESRLGLALRHHPRSSFHLSTKVGRSLLPIHDDERNVVVAERSGWQGSQAFDIEFDFSFDAVVKQHEQSLQRLGVGRVDCLVIHDMEQSAGGGAGGMSYDVAPGSETVVQKTVAEHTEVLFGERGGFKALEALRKAGTIKAFGAAANCPGDVMATDVVCWLCVFVFFFLGGGLRPLFHDVCFCVRTEKFKSSCATGTLYGVAPARVRVCSFPSCQPNWRGSPMPCLERGKGSNHGLICVGFFVITTHWVRCLDR